MVSVDTSDQPRFNFADSESARCSSTCLLQLPVKECGVKLRVHARDKGTVPVLLSVDTLRRMKAIVDYGNDQAVFAGINFQKCVALETTTTGHQILPLAQDFMQNSFPLSEPVRRIGVPASECEERILAGTLGMPSIVIVFDNPLAPSRWQRPCRESQAIALPDHTRQASQATGAREERKERGPAGIAFGFTSVVRKLEVFGVPGTTA